MADKETDKKRKKDKKVDKDAGYETDTGPSTRRKLKSRRHPKLPNSAGVDGYETDDGYTSSSKKKSKFFRLGNKSKSQLDEISQPRAVSPPPVFRTPIADRFATTLASLNAGATVDPPLGPPALPLSTLTSSVSAKDTDTEPDSAGGNPKRSAVRFASSDSSDHHGSTSSGPSLFSKVASSSPASSPTSSLMSHSKVPLISSSPPEEPAAPSPRSKRPDPLSLAAPPNWGGSKSMPNSRVPSPSPTGSPFVLLTPIDPSAPIPSEPDPPPPSRRRFISKAVEDISLKIGTARSPQTVTIDTGPRRIVTSQVGSIIPSAEHLIASPQGESLEPPTNTFSYYELPPPSPPPLSPLPQPPSQEGMGSSRFADSQSRALSASSPTPSRSVSPFGGPAPRRGIEAPFPSRPVLPGPGAHTRGFEVRANVERYRDIYAVNHGSRSTTPTSRPNLALNTQTHDMIISPVAASAPPMLRGPTLRNPPRENRRAVAFETPYKVGISVEVPSDPEDDDQWGQYADEDDDPRVMDDVLKGFQTFPEHFNQSSLEPALGRSRSIEAKATRQATYNDVDDRSRHSVEDDRATTYTVNTLSDAASRLSFLDESKSEAARQRFVNRIEAMFDDSGREKLPPRHDAIPPVPKLLPRQDAIPPVPKLPQSLVATKTSKWF